MISQYVHYFSSIFSAIYRVRLEHFVLLLRIFNVIVGERLNNLAASRSLFIFLIFQTFQLKERNQQQPETLARKLEPKRLKNVITPKQLIIKNIQIKRMLKLATLAVCFILLVKYAQCYLDISLMVNRSKTYISYGLPMKVNGIDYYLSTSLRDSKQFIVPLSEKTGKSKKNKKHKPPAGESSSLAGTLVASSLEGYSFEGWKRFFMEAFLFIESRYYHEISINLDSIDHKKLDESDKRDGLISFGPNLADNKIYQLIKNSTEFVKNDIVSIYRGVNDKNVRMQLGGFQESYARGNRNGILFYELQIQSREGKYWVPFKSVSCMRERSGKDDIFYIANSQISLALSIESPYLKVPASWASDFERNFETPHISCKITEDQILSCSNMTSVDLSLDFIQLQIDQGAFINISLHDLRDEYNQKTTETTFRIQFTNDPNEYQIGQALFQSHYVSIDMGMNKMYFSPINRFPSETYGVYVIRFLVGFGLFTVVSAIGAMIWQTFNDPFRKNKLMLDQDGVRLVEYHRPNEFKSEDM